MDWATIYEFWMKLMEILAQGAFPGVLFAMGTRITLRDMGRELDRPWVLLRIFATTSILAPLATAAVIALFPELLPKELGGLMLISAATGGSVFALLGVRSKHGNMALGTTSMALLSLVMCLTLPPWLWLFNHWFPLHLTVLPGRVFMTVVPFAVLPMLAGAALNTWRPSIAKILGSIANKLSIAAMLILWVTFLKLALVNIFTTFSLAGYVAVFIVTTITLYAGYYSVGGKNRGDKLTGAMTATQTNLGAWLLVIHISYPSEHIWPLATAYIVLRTIYIIPWYHYFKYRVKQHGG